MKRLKLIFQKEIFLLLLPFFFVLHGYVLNYPSVPINDAGLVLLRYLLIIAVFLVLFLLLFREFRKAAWFTFWLFVLQFFFGPFHDGLKAFSKESFFSKHIFLFPVFFLAYVAFFLWLKRTNLNFAKVFMFFNMLLSVWLVIDFGTLAFKSDPNPKRTPIETKSSCDTCYLPDVYFIIADEYASHTALKEVFAFDNTKFEDSLRRRGFHVLVNSTSNYNYTPYSIASILSMNYLEGISRRSNEQVNRQIAYAAINNNAVINEFEKLGYQFINYSPFDFADQPTQVSTQFFLTREKLITGQTYTQRLMKDIGFNFVTTYKINPLIRYWAYSTWESNTNIIRQVRTTSSEKKSHPRFIYTHLFMPHYPYYFNEKGEAFPIESLAEGKQVNKSQYIAYLNYCNKIFLQLLEHILMNSPKPPVIIFMGDHGFRHFIAPVEQKYHFMNFNAVYFPNQNYKQLNTKVSAVNQFRIILNTQLNKKFPMLKDSTSFLLEY